MSAGFRRTGAGATGYIQLSTIPSSFVTKRYVRFQEWSGEALAGGYLDLNEIELFDETNTLITGITVTAPGSVPFGSVHPLSSAVDGVKTIASRIGESPWNSTKAAAAILQLDLGSAKTLSSLRLYSTFNQPGLPSTVNMYASDSPTSGYTLVATITRGSATAIGGDVHSYGPFSLGVAAQPDLTVKPPAGTLGLWQDRWYAYIAQGGGSWKQITLV